MLDCYDIMCCSSYDKDSICQWIACNNIVCVRKNLTCITRESNSHYATSSKLPNINFSFNNSKRLEVGESCNKKNHKSFNGSSKISAIKYKLCNTTLNKFEYEECHLLRRCCNLKSSSVCTSSVCDKVSRTRQANSVCFHQRPWGQNNSRFYFFIFLLFIMFMRVTANELSVETDVAFKNESDGEFQC